MDLCENCGHREATVRWAGDSDSLSIARNPQHLTDWCERCCIEAQLEYARERAKAIPALERRLRELRKEASKLDSGGTSI